MLSLVWPTEAGGSQGALPGRRATAFFVLQTCWHDPTPSMAFNNRQYRQARGPGSATLVRPMLALRSSLAQTSISSTGTAITTVLEADAPRPSIVWRVRNCMAPGLSAMVGRRRQG